MQHFTTENGTQPF